MKYKIEEIKNKILCGDALTELQKIPDESIDTIITSPPYWALRDYQIEGQIGLEPTLEEYLEKLLKITAELKRVLKPSGIMFWNHGDCYNSHSTGKGNVGGIEGRRKNKQDNVVRGKIKIELPDKCLVLQNWRLILKMIDDDGDDIYELNKGFILCNNVTDAIQRPRKTKTILSGVCQEMERSSSGTISQKNEGMEREKQRKNETIQSEVLLDAQRTRNNQGNEGERQKTQKAEIGSPNEIWWKSSEMCLLWGGQNLVFDNRPYQRQGQSTQERNPKIWLNLRVVKENELSRRFQSFMYELQLGNREIWILPPSRGRNLCFRKRDIPIDLLPLFKLKKEERWLLRNVIIWHKPNHMPSSVKDRFTNAYEPVFMLVKNKKYYFDLDAVRIPPKTLYSQIRAMFNYRVRDAEKKSKQCPQFKATKEEIERYKKDYGIKNPRDVWEISTQKAMKEEIEFWLKKLDEGGKQREAKKWFLDWLKEHPDGTYEQFYEEMKSKKISKYANEGWSQLQDWENHFKNFVAYLGMPHPLGKNPGDLWQIPTQPAPPEVRGKHFATFPEKLVEPMILAGCPAQVCKKCGKPRERIIVSLYKGTTIGTKPKEGKILEKACQLQRTTSGLPFGYTGKTIGWTDCGCGAGFEPGIVLDPFIGSGTVAVVAKKLGRNFIGIELNKEYVKIVEERLKKIPNPLL
jgi:DNA modification methylase